MPIEQIKTALNFGTQQDKKNSPKKIKKNPAVENILKNLVAFKPTERNADFEAAKIASLYFGIKKHSEDKRSEFPEERFVKNEQGKGLSLAEEIAHKKVLYQYVISHVEIEELRAYIKTLSSPGLLRSFEAALKERDQAEYKKFIEAACEFQMEEREEREANAKAAINNNNEDDEGHIIVEDKGLIKALAILEGAAVLEVGLLLALAVEHKMHEEFVEVINLFAEGINSHHAEKQEKNDEKNLDSNPVNDKKRKLKFETPESEERFLKIVELLLKRFHELPTHEDKQQFCKECLNTREMIKASQSKDLETKKKEVQTFRHSTQHSQLGL